VRFDIILACIQSETVLTNEHRISLYRTKTVHVTLLRTLEHILSNLNVLIVISKGMWAVNLENFAPVKSFQFLTGGLTCKVVVLLCVRLLLLNFSKRILFG